MYQLRKFDLDNEYVKWFDDSLNLNHYQPLIATDIEKYDIGKKTSFEKV